MGKIALTSSIICLMTGVVLYVCLCLLCLMHPFAISKSQCFPTCMWLCLHSCIYFCRCLRARDIVSECVCVCLWESVPSGSEIALCGGEGGGELWSTGMETCRSCYRIIISLKTLHSVLHPLRCTCSPAHAILSAAFSLHLHQYTQCRSSGVTPGPSCAVCVVCRIGTEHTVCLAALTYFQTLLWQLSQSSPPERPLPYFLR